MTFNRVLHPFSVMSLILLAVAAAASCEAELDAVYAQLVTEELPDPGEVVAPELNMEYVDWYEVTHPIGGAADSWEILRDILKPLGSSLDLRPHAMPIERATTPISFKRRCNKSACLKGVQSFGLCKIHLREAFRAGTYSDALKRAKSGQAPYDTDGFRRK